jgi:hypothetical protein
LLLVPGEGKSVSQAPPARRLAAVLLGLFVVGVAIEASASRGGPDSYGYTWRDDREPGVSYTRIDFQPPPADVFVTEPAPDGSSPFIALPFAFPFYGRDYTTVSIGEDGWLSFADELASDATPSRLPDPDGPAAMVAPLWEGLSLGSRGRGDFIRHQDHAGAGAFVIEWFRARVDDSGEDATFQVWLHPDGRIRFQYLNVAGEHPGATIGLEAGDGGSGLEVMSLGTPVDGFAVRSKSAVEFMPPTPGADCATPVDCGDTLSDRIGRNPDALQVYAGCTPGLHEGAEVARTLTLTELTHLSATLSGSIADNELFLLTGCSELACLAGGDAVARDFLPPGRYVLAVDTIDTAGGQRFDLEVSCTPALQPVSCGRVDGTLGAANRIGSWSCLGLDSGAGEALFLVSLPLGGDLLATLDRADLQVVVSELAGFPFEGARCLSAGTGRTWASDLPPGDYVVAVDGPAGASGGFVLELECGGTRTESSSCGAVVSGTLPPAGLLDGWSCGAPLPGGETLQSFQLDSLATLALTLSSDEELSILLLDGRTEGPRACLARSDDGFLSYPNAPPGPYVVVVESVAGGDFELSIDCQEPIGSVCTPWEWHDGDVEITGLQPFTQHGQVEIYELATPPPAEDLGWGPAPDPNTIGYARTSRICGHTCLTALDFTYFRTWVRLPATVADFRVNFSTIDDGVQVRLNGEVAGHGFLGGGAVDLTGSPFLRPGELNEVLLVQVDDCCSWNELSGTACFIAGEDPPCVAEVALPAEAIACPGETLRLLPTFSNLENCFDLAEYRWLADGVVVRDWDADPRLFHVAGADPQVMTVELRCRADALCIASASQLVRAPGDPVLPEVSPWLRVRKAGGEVELDWTGAATPRHEGHFHVRRSPSDSQPFGVVSHGSIFGTTWRDTAPVEPLILYDVRSSDGCERESHR